MKKIDRIIISGDLFRFKNNEKLEPFNYVRIFRYYELLKFQLERASGKKVEIWNSSATQVCMDIYDILNIKVNNQFDWVNIYDLQEIPEQLIEWYKDKIENALVIYNEPSKTVKKIHNILGVPYIDIMPHPVRFLDDHLFAIETNDKEIFDYFNGCEKKEFDDFYIQAQLIKTQLAKPIGNLKENSVLLIGQTEIDKSLIVNGKLRSLNNYFNEIEKLLDVYSYIYFTPHPYVKDYRIYNCLQAIKNCSIVKYNTYNLMSQHQIKAVAGISSSVIYESLFFGKENIFFQKNYECMLPSPILGENYFFTLSKEQILQPSFWGKIFGNDIDEIKLNFYPNQIRASLNDYWSFTEYDPVIRTMKRSEYGEYITKLKKANPTEHIIKIEDYISKIKTINVEQHKKVQQELKVGNKESNISSSHALDTLDKNLIILKLLKRIPVIKELNELITFKALSDKLRKSFSSQSKSEKIHCLTYRPRAKNGGRGGAGAVQSAIQQIIGIKCNQIPVIYTYSERDGVWHNENNKFYTEKRFPKIYNKDTKLMQLWANMVFVYDKARNEEAVYITHEIFTAYALALLRKKYVLVVHSQGSKIHEMTALGEESTLVTRYIINQCEQIALKSAYKVYFPSKGARESYIKDTHYTGANISNIPLYNTVYAHPDIEPIENIKRDDAYVTFISVGTLTDSKGQDQTLDYISKLAKENNVSIRWICVGRGPLKERLIKKSKEYEAKINNFKFIYLEKIPYPSVRYLLSIADIYIMLHRVSIFDLATLEAMENGLMIILSNTGGNAEFNVCDNIVFAGNEPIKLDNDLIKKYKNKSLSAFKHFNNEMFYKTYSSVIKDLTK